MISIRPTPLLIALAAALTLPAMARAQDAAPAATVAPAEQTASAPMTGMGHGMGMRHGAEGCRMHPGGMMGGGKPCMMGQHKGCRMGGGAAMTDKRLDMLEKRMDMMQMMLEMMVKQQADADSQ